MPKWLTECEREELCKKAIEGASNKELAEYYHRSTANIGKILKHANIKAERHVSKEHMGQRFGRLIAQRPTSKRRHNSVVWLFLCDCGRPYEGSIKNAIDGDLKSCGECGLVGGNPRRTEESVIEQAKNVHGDKDDLSHISLEHEGGRGGKCWIRNIICKVNNDHRPYDREASQYMLGKRCNPCGQVSKGKKLTCPKEQWIEECKSHPCNSSYCYDHIDYRCKSDTVKDILCLDCGKYFEANGQPHSKGLSGCKNALCPNASKRESAIARHWLDSVGIPNIRGKTREFHIAGSLYHADGYDPQTNTVYEFNGCHVHGCQKCGAAQAYGLTSAQTYSRWLKKKEFYLQHGYKVVEMWDCEWRKLYLLD